MIWFETWLVFSCSYSMREFDNLLLYVSTSSMMTWTYLVGAKDCHTSGKGWHKMSLWHVGHVKALVWFWWIDETLSANLVYLSDQEIGNTIASGGTMVKIMMMVWPWWWSSAWTWKRIKRKTKSLRQRWNLIGAFWFSDQDTLRVWSHLGLIAVLLRGGETRIKMRLSKCH